MLTIFLRQAREFRLAIALYNDLLARDALIRALTGELVAEGVRVLTLDLREDQPRPLHTLYARVDALVKTAAPGERVVVMVVNLEARVDYTPELALPGGPGTAFLETANLHRELFPRACPGPLVLWTTELLERAFVQNAPDLWHWRSHTFDLRTRIEARPSALATPDSRGLPSSDDRLHPAERLARLEEELAAYRKATMRHDEARVLNNIGWARLDAGDARLARNDFEAAVGIARELGDRQNEGIGLGGLGAAYRSLGEMGKAIDCLEKASVIARTAGNRRSEGTALGGLGVIYRNLNEPEKAVGYHEQQLAIAREIGDQRGEAAALNGLGSAYYILGKTPDALRCYRQGLSLARLVGDRWAEGSVLGNLGAAYQAAGESEKAVGYHEQQLAIAREIGDQRGEGTALHNLALRFWDSGERSLAIASMKESLLIHQATDDPWESKVRAKLEEWHRQLPPNLPE